MVINLPELLFVMSKILLECTNQCVVVGFDLVLVILIGTFMLSVPHATGRAICDPNVYFSFSTLFLRKSSSIKVA